MATPTFRSAQSSASNATIYTFSAFAAGAGQADLRGHATISGSGAAQTIASVTIGGVSATINEQFQDPAENQSPRNCIATATIPSGGSTDVVVTFSGGMSRCGCGLWTSTGLTSDAAHDTATSDTDPSSGTVDTLDSGFVLAVVGNGSGGSFTWTNATERYDSAVGGEGAAHSGADAATSAGTLNVQADHSNATDRRSFVLASFGVPITVGKGLVESNRLSRMRLAA